ncbi:hypothetical protein DZA28_13410 [Pseudomonas alloputida]|jgi:hypothetical protein|uniref:Lipoprotein n=8 Tax=Pseudomonas TaxID=286 RepID=A0A7L9GAJ2_9PSED|nr:MULTISPECIES: hypothetical protein [Pseudomonas]AFK67324.1 hypothetical protein YSA_01013 [Pseudomonas putida ND6]ANI04308.1 hypothetical protein A210_17175 [Pseudomonas putida SJTE-1]ANI33952.1 hypothetical protein AA098_10845 [Pseudomonas sp. JY-Q]AYN11556.1 hypothetical protein CHN49_17430 [Pseudomonas putida]EKT4476450.1 hypothetical protein [Pseudomonas putida]
MPRLPKLLLPLLLAAAFTACDQKPSREDQILSQLPLQDAYTHNIERMSALLGRTHPQLSQATIQDVLRKHLTVEDQRRDLFRLYSEKNFSDAEFATIVAATQDPAKARALEDTEAGKRLSEKLTALMRETARDVNVQALVEQRMQEVEDELDALDKAGS